jgi:NADH-ubiquinone oxidoreductase chain 5
MYITIIFLPLLASIMSGFLGRKLGVTGSQFITCSSILISTLLSIFIFFEVGFNNIAVKFKLFK